MTYTMAIYRRDVTSYTDNMNGEEYFFMSQDAEDIKYRDTNLVAVRKDETELAGYFTLKDGIEWELAEANGDDSLRLYIKGGSRMGYSASDVVNKVASYDGVGQYRNA